MGQPLTEPGIWLTTVQFLVETVASGDILQFEIDFKMVALTEASMVLHGLLRQRWLQPRSSACHPHDEAVREGRRDPSMGPSPQPLVLSIIRLLASRATLVFLHSRALQAHFHKPFTISLLKSPPLPAGRWFLASHVGMQRGTRPSAATWDLAATQDARAAVSSATKITSRLSTYFRTVPSCRATRPNYSRLLLYLLMDAACVCPAYCTFPCKGLPRSLLCSELSSGPLPHTC